MDSPDTVDTDSLHEDNLEYILFHLHQFNTQTLNFKKT